MNKYTYLAVALLITPHLASAQAGTFQGLFANLLIFIDSTVIPFLIGIAFLFLAINIVRYFIIGGSNEEGREKAKSLAIYGVGAFVFILIFWGIVNLIATSIGLEECTAITPDYVDMNSTTPRPPHCLPTTP
jgi:Type IV secretion system pilin